jgi:hypothetical protein
MNSYLEGTEHGAQGFAPMPRFYFDLRLNGSLTADEDGEELPDLAAAKREAAQVAAHLTEELFKGASLEFCIDVRDDRGQTVARANVSLDVERIVSSPAASLSD